MCTCPSPSRSTSDWFDMVDWLEHVPQRLESLVSAGREIGAESSDVRSADSLGDTLRDAALADIDARPKFLVVVPYPGAASEPA